MASTRLHPTDVRMLQGIARAAVRANGEIRNLQFAQQLAEIRERQLRLHRDELNRIERICSEALGLGTLENARAEAKFMRLRAELAERQRNWFVQRFLEQDAAATPGLTAEKLLAWVDCEIADGVVKP